MNQVRWARYQGIMDAAECQRVQGHPIHQIGDTILVWVNEGDILAYGHSMDKPEDPEVERLRAAITKFLSPDPRKSLGEKIDVLRNAVYPPIGRTHTLTPKQ